MIFEESGEHLFESPSFYMDKDEDSRATIVCKSTNQKAVFEPYASQGLTNTIYQQADMGNDYSVTLERIGQTIMLQGGFF